MFVKPLRSEGTVIAHTKRLGLAVPRGMRGLRVSLLATIAFVAVVSVGGTTVYAQVAQGSTVVVDPEASGPTGQLH